MKRKSIYSVLSVLLLAVVLLFTPLTRMTVDAKIKELFPIVVLTKYSHTMSIGDEFHLAAVTSTGKLPTFRSSKSSVASVNTYGVVTAKKAGICKITAKIKGGEASCAVTVRPTTVTIRPSSITLFRQNTKKLTADVSTGHIPVWKSSRSSVVEVDENGTITAIKHGTAKITAKVDGATATCTVTVKQPTVNLSASEIELDIGKTQLLSASVSSGNKPEWTTSNMNIAAVDQNGRVTALRKGRAYIYAREDGAKASCRITVKDPNEKKSKR